MCIDSYMIIHVESFCHINVHVESLEESICKLLKFSCLVFFLLTYKYVFVTFGNIFIWSEQVVVWI
jgi:hypothetical protein